MKTNYTQIWYQNMGININLSGIKDVNVRRQALSPKGYEYSFASSNNGAFIL